VRAADAPPQLRLPGGAARQFEKNGGRSSLLTITHDDSWRDTEDRFLGRR